MHRAVAEGHVEGPGVSWKLGSVAIENTPPLCYYGEYAGWQKFAIRLAIFSGYGRYPVDEGAIQMYTILGRSAMSDPKQEPVPPPIQGLSRGRLLQALKEQIAGLEGAGRPAGEDPVASGCPPLDRLLPGRGFRRGTLVDWLSSGDGSGAQTLALGTAREACREGGALVVLDQAREFYPPAAVRLGIEPDHMIVVQAANQADNTWALDQALRCLGVAAVLAWPEKFDGRTFRRLQLAAEQGGNLGLLVRPQSVRHEPSWADVRLLVEPLPPAGPAGRRRLRIELLHTRGGSHGGNVEVELDDETHTVHPATRLVRPTDHPRAAGA